MIPSLLENPNPFPALMPMAQHPTTLRLVVILPKTKLEPRIKMQMKIPKTLIHPLSSFLHVSISGNVSKSTFMEKRSHQTSSRFVHIGKRMELQSPNTSGRPKTLPFTHPSRQRSPSKGFPTQPVHLLKVLIWLTRSMWTNLELQSTPLARQETTICK